ncbi:Asp-tRNA(Asn)/Glu-tRNA(Gln) amidotransferase GatCAB subunit B, partial [Clostridioides difficile]|nr:Asp-tRNA(Asn)/Glu-tRNA(Gln) amidotransferase GatCAB subunit B [Clostridioides difficile]
LRDIMIALGVSEARMERGNLRCDANVSLMPRGSETLGTRTETKNVNSLRSVEGALRYEIQRQGYVLSAGRKVRQQTRMWQEADEYTITGRDKSDAEDYRYFPEPDLVPIAPSREWVEQLRAELPELPAAKKARLSSQWQFSEMDMTSAVNAGALDLLEATVDAGCQPAAARKWWLTELSRRANEAGVDLAEVGMT